MNANISSKISQSSSVLLDEIWSDLAVQNHSGPPEPDLVTLILLAHVSAFPPHTLDPHAIRSLLFL